MYRKKKLDFLFKRKIC